MSFLKTSSTPDFIMKSLNNAKLGEKRIAGGMIKPQQAFCFSDAYSFNFSFLKCWDFFPSNDEKFNLVQDFSRHFSIVRIVGCLANKKIVLNLKLML